MIRYKYILNCRRLAIIHRYNFNLNIGEAGMVEQCTYEKYEFKKKLETLRSKSGRGTELISLYIPFDKQISDVSNHLREEHLSLIHI